MADLRTKLLLRAFILTAIIGYFIALRIPGSVGAMEISVETRGLRDGTSRLSISRSLSSKPVSIRGQPHESNVRGKKAIRATGKRNFLNSSIRELDRVHRLGGTCHKIGDC